MSPERSGIGAWVGKVVGLRLKMMPSSAGGDIKDIHDWSDWKLHCPQVFDTYRADSFSRATFFMQCGDPVCSEVLEPVEGAQPRQRDAAQPPIQRIQSKTFSAAGRQAGEVAIREHYQSRISRHNLSNTNRILSKWPPPGGDMTFDESCMMRWWLGGTSVPRYLAQSRVSARAD